ncbi:unnamed protein product [Leptosia nina]|uniref:Delta(14)-sterol reductase n=1 Tax=Leptosia nina TaxID=320188 RepID=A0AAV1K2P8_9NEOP
MSTRSGRVRASIADSSPSRRRKVSPSRSPARNRKSSRERTATRQSPSRKSPSRKSISKYPARKSPFRAVKEKEDSLPKSPAKRPAINTNPAIKLDDFKFEIYRGTRSKRTEYYVKDVASKAVEEVNGFDSTDSSEYSLRNRRSVDAQKRPHSVLQTENAPVTHRSISKSLSKSVSKSISKSIDAYSDDEYSMPSREKSISVVRKLSTPVPSSGSLGKISNKFEFGGQLGSACLILCIPFAALAILLTCTYSCSYKVLLDLSQIKSIYIWSFTSFILVMCHYLLQAIILTLPVLGTKQVDESGKKYCFNAFFSCIVTLIFVYSLDYFRIFDSNTILESYFQMAIISYIIAVAFSLIFYIKSRKTNENDLNPYGNTGYKLYDFFMGREINPQIKKFSLKLWTYRICNVGTLILLLLLFKHSFYMKEQDIDSINFENYKELISKVQLRSTTLVVTLMQIIYTLHFIVKEYKVIHTFYWQCEGLGYMQLTASALYPYYFTTISKYVVDSKLSLGFNALIAASFLFIVGFIILLTSNNIKYEFRKNPLQPGIVHLDSMPTFHGKKLLVSNLWGFVRHPNYLGDILIHLALALPGALSLHEDHVATAVLPALLPIFMLIHRAWRDHCRCQRRYGAAWQRYCKRVPSIILPKIF